MILAYRIVAISLGLSLVRLSGCDTPAAADAHNAFGTNLSQRILVSPEHSGPMAASRQLPEKNA